MQCHTPLPWSPRHPLGPFRTDPRIYATSPQSGLRITWFGHNSSLVEIDGARVLIDPVWDERAAPTRWAGPKRFFTPPLALGHLPAIDAVIISHNHYDHLGSGTVRRLAQMATLRQARWISPLGVGAIFVKEVLSRIEGHEHSAVLEAPRPKQEIQPQDKLKDPLLRNVTCSRHYASRFGFV